MSEHSPRVLLIAHGFPPASGSGAQRALACARYLPMYGWRPTVLTVETPWAAPRDDALLREVPPGTRVVRTRSAEPRPASQATSRAQASADERSVERKLRAAETLAGASWKPREVGPADTSADASWQERQLPRSGRVPGALRRHLGHAKRFPDAHLGWLPFAVAAALREPCDVLYSTSGPFSSHLVALIVHRLTGTPWVAELRDGWYAWNRSIFPDYPAWRGVLEQRLEALTIRGADRVVLVTDRMAHAFAHQYPDVPSSHFRVVANGFDPAQLLAAEEPAQRGPGFEVLHAGALYYGRSIARVLDAARHVVERDPAFARAFRLTLVGSLDQAAQRELAHHALGDRVRVRGYLDHAATLRAMRAAALLLLVANTTRGAEATVPGKLFEYLASGRPVLGIGPACSSTRDVLEQTHGGWFAAADDREAIAGALHQAFTTLSHGALQSDAAAVARYDRRRLLGTLAGIFDEIRAPRRL